MSPLIRAQARKRISHILKTSVVQGLLWLTAISVVCRADNSGRIYLTGGQAVPAQYSGSDALLKAIAGASQLSFASADLDSDGVADFLQGFQTDSGGALIFRRGNLDAVAPQSQASFDAIGRSQFPAPFLAAAQVVASPVRPDFLSAGNLTGLNGSEVALAASGDNTVYVVSVDGGQVQINPLLTVPGSIVSVAAGSGPFTLVVGVRDDSGSSRLLVYSRGQDGLALVRNAGLTADPAQVAFGDVDGDGVTDAVILTGGNVFALRGGDLANAVLEGVPTANLVTAIALGSFLHDRSPQLQIALLQADGSVHILAQSGYDPTPLSQKEVMERRQARLRRLRSKVHQAAPRTVPGPVTWQEIESYPN
ncbi:MAG: hypothetical protein JO022_07320, partial [Acidobacteriaceae bacterium]|nr:hypothetical protein [Acidobacteriaceae bacterium]